MSLPLVRLSFLDAIRGFVAVGRRMSVTLAAEDLCLTQSAVSRQVLALEQALGVKLLVRGHRSISFTAEGERLFRSADGAVQQLQDVIAAISTVGGRRPVTITTSIGVAGLWLLPRLGRLQRRHAGLDVRVAANNRPVPDLRAEGIDLAIRYCAPTAAPPQAIRLFGETVAPVAHPSLGLAALRSAQALRTQFLLEFDDPRRPWLQWGDWLNAAGWGNARPKGILRFNQYDQVIQAALAGQGIALGRIGLIAPMLADGRLQALPTPRGAPATSHAYWLIQAEAEPRADVAAVAAWIRAEVAADLAGQDGPRAARQARKPADR